jgi:hypothetical protein
MYIQKTAAEYDGKESNSLQIFTFQNVLHDTQMIILYEEPRGPIIEYYPETGYHNP